MFQNNQYPMWQIPYNPQMNGYSQPNYLQTQNVFETRKVSASNIIQQLQPVAKPAYVVNSPYVTTYYPNACPCQNL